MKALAESRGGRALDLDGHFNTTSPFEQQIDFRAVLGAIVVRSVSIARERDQFLDDEAFPTGSGHGMPQHIVPTAELKQGMGESAVANKGLGCADEALANVAVRGSCE